MTAQQDGPALREVYGEPSDLVKRKVLPSLDKHCRAFIAASPFLVIASADASGAADASPRGDAPGFVAVLDERHLLIPERPGNRLLDSLTNVQANPNVGLLFLVPGMNETLRVNGTAEVTFDADLLAPLAAQGKAPLSGLLVTVQEAFLHCAKAFIRSRLWDPAAQVDRKSFPTLGKMIADQIEGLDAEATEAGIQKSYRERLY
jgi:PPOX class probable FMN-dependent enzyme